MYSNCCKKFKYLNDFFRNSNIKWELLCLPVAHSNLWRIETLKSFSANGELRNLCDSWTHGANKISNWTWTILIKIHIFVSEFPFFFVHIRNLIHSFEKWNSDVFKVKFIKCNIKLWELPSYTRFHDNVQANICHKTWIARCEC